MTKQDMISKLLNSSDAYYNKSKSLISDKEFDDLKDKFSSLYPADPFLKTIGTPVPKNSKWPKATHKLPMYSCNKVNTEVEFKKWCNENVQSNYILSEKLDGISIEIIYEKGKLVQAITRGDGEIGEDITSNVIKMKNVKTDLIVDLTGSVRGEIILKSEDFKAINEISKIRGQKQLKNMRNGASGLAKRLDGNYAEYLTVLYYNMCSDESFDTKEEMFTFFEKVLKIETCPYYVYPTPNDCLKMLEEYNKSIRLELDYEIDGLIIESNIISVTEELGMLGGNLRGMIAYKFPPMMKATKLIDIEFSMGRSGRYTPVAILEPVAMGGVTISRASLANMDLFNKFSFNKEDIVMVSRANDVIPCILSIEAKGTGEKFKPPTHCAYCNSILSIGTFLTCENEECDGNKLGNLEKFIKKLDLKGIATSTITQLYDAGLVEEPSDFYELNREDLESLDGFGDKKIENILTTINSKKELTLPEFVSSLNIPQFSEETAELLVSNGVKNVQDLRSLSRDTLVGIKGIGAITANAIIEGIKNKANVIDNLIFVGIIIKEKEKVMSKGEKLDGKSFVFTGTINKIDPETGKHYTRDKLQQFVIENGGETPSGISKTVTYLVQADPNELSTKTQKALKFGVKILSEEAFFALIED